MFIVFSDAKKELVLEFLGGLAEKLALAGLILRSAILTFTPLKLGAMRNIYVTYRYVNMGMDMAWKWICISLESQMVSWYKNKIV